MTTDISEPNDTAADPGSRARQISLARIAEFGIRPKHDLGQNFLVDDNIVRLILAQLQAGPDDVALEVGAGLGVLTAALAGATAHVHAFEIDRSLGPALVATLAADGRASRVSLHFEDILRADLPSLRPLPTVCASNLPYSAAGPFLVHALRGIPGVRRYCVMVQREVAERMAATPGSKTYGTLSVWVQHYASIAGMRPLSRNIFYPRPGVDSSLVTMVRRPPEELPQVDDSLLARVIQAAFGQRRKTLVNALAAGLGLSRNDVANVVEELGLPADVRAERLTPDRFAALAAKLL
jgi:16S rRNA (adenine1518-N6/adenine1519-N6)-dimethyltransferase